MLFSDEELAKIADWQPVADGFGRDDDTIRKHVMPALESLKASGFWDYHTWGNGGLSNYYSATVFPYQKRRRVFTTLTSFDCVAVYLSLMLPVGVVGRTSVSIDARISAFTPLDLDSIVEPVYGADDLLNAVLDAFKDTAYQFMDRDAVSQPLPPNVTPDEYCLCSEPWDRAFHALFADTD
ncbi:MAG: hypothetical protein HQ581_21650 [Planctomycetes bacterium]|nr:hypothetical protein [Planctomycetota bacterium]